jgi:hypothetical protein
MAKDLDLKAQSRIGFQPVSLSTARHLPSAAYSARRELAGSGPSL